MTSNLDLLRQFARENSQDAFAEIVRRHLDLVYSAARRQVRSPELAEDIAQSVFADLARTAGRLKDDTLLTGWLYAVTRRTAIDAVRKESRRQLREQVAVEMNTMNATPDDWAQIAPLLDDAMATLDETDRAAVLLRYFENKSLREVGHSLNISDDAAQKRVSRAVERLREFFTKQRLTIGTAGLVALISSNAVQSAPVGLAATTCATALLGGTAIQTSTLMTSTKTIAMTSIQKSLIAAALVTVAGTGIYAAHKNSALRAEIQTLQQQQAPLAAQMNQLQQDLDDATNRLAGLMVDNAQLKSHSNESELLKLRAEVTRLENSQPQNENDPTTSAAKALIAKVNQIKQWLELHPNEKIPELQLLSERAWLRDATFSGDLNTDDDFEAVLSQIRCAAKQLFANSMGRALDSYIADNNGQLPNDLSQIEPYFNPPVDTATLQRYQLLQTGNLSDLPQNAPIIQEKAPVDDQADSLFTISPTGYSYQRTGTLSLSGNGTGEFGADVTAQIKPYTK